MELPIIKLEIERMKHTMVVAMSEYQAQIDSNLKAAVEAFCQPENLKRIIDAQVEQTLKQVIEEEVKNFFRYGKGRQVVSAAVVAKLSEQIDR